MLPLIAIVGRPNVGKSALFNRLVGRRIAIVHDQPGVTRDRISAQAEWRDHSFTLVDTGGIGLLRGEKADDPIVGAALEQVRLAIDAAHVIILVVDSREGVMPLDREVAARLRQSGKPVVVAANKVDTARQSDTSLEFAELAFEHVCPVSAIHERGIDSLMAIATQQLPKPLPCSNTESPASPSSAPLKLAIVGRPNVGKSSILNALTQSPRVIVSPLPGTTRDSIDVPFDIVTNDLHEPCLLIDTAGIRKPRHVHNSIEFYSVKRAEDAITRCDIAILVLDAESGITEQDKKIADKITSAHKACILVVNKWDLFQPAVTKAQLQLRTHPPRPARSRNQHQPPSSLADFANWVQQSLFFLDYAPVIFTSATTGINLDRLLEAIRYVASQSRQKIPTALLNRTLQQAVERRQPISRQGHFLKFFYATQTDQTPPTFLLFVNRDELFSDPYKKYLAGQLRAAFGFEGCPILLIPKPRPQSITPVRTSPHRKSSPSLKSKPRHRHSKP
jgi:GTPase